MKNTAHDHETTEAIRQIFVNDAELIICDN